MNRRILLADDSLTIQKVVELTFADTDFEVFAVSSGDELVAKLPEVKPDIIICDIIMPGRDGYDVCQEIKSSPDFLHLPVILLTGTFEPFDRDRALAVGCSEIITKPFEAKRLVEAVENLTAGGDGSQQRSGAGDGASDFDDGRVTPPPPIVAPDVLVDVESDYDLADTAVTSEEDPAETPEDTAVEELEFTASGFEEMETAGRERAEQVLEAPADGLDFDIESTGSEFGEAAPDPNLDTSPFSRGDIEEPVLPIEGGDEPFATPADESPNTPESSDVEVFPEAGGPVFDEPSVADEDDQNLTTPINVAEVMRSAPDASLPDDEEEPSAPVSDDVDASNADTQDLGPRREAQAETEAPGIPDETPGLSEEDVDRIARRLLELAGDRIDRIAWEVLPDMAEIVVRERVREIEAAIEGEAS